MSILVRAMAVLAAVSYLTILSIGWVLNAPVGYDGVLRPQPHEIGSGRGFTVLEVEPGSPAAGAGVRSGDVVAAVDGNPFVFDPHQTYHNRRAGEAATLRIVDGTGASSTAAFTLESRLASPSLLLGLVVASVLGIAIMAVGAGVAFIRPEYPSARLLLVFALALAINTTSDLWHWTQQVAVRANVIDWLTGITLVVGSAALLHLLLIFPAPGPIYARVRRAIWGVYALALTLVAVVPLSGSPGAAAVATTLIVVVLLLAALFVFEFSYRRPPTPLARAQLGWIRWGLAVGISATVLDRLALLLVPAAVPAVVTTVVAAAWLAFPVSLAFAVMRYRLFEVDRVIRASITWGILVTVLLTSYLALVVVMGRFAGSLLGPTTGADPTASIVAALVVAAMVHPLRTRLHRRLERHIYHQRFARRLVLDQATEFMARPQAPSSLTRFLTRHVPTSLSLSSAWLAVPAEYAVQFEVDPAVLLPNVSLAAPALVDAMGRVAGPVLLAPAEDLDVYQAMPVLSVEAPGAAPWYAAGARVVVPMRGSSGALLALWVLGAYFSGDLFEREDLTALERIAVLTAMQLEREALRGGVRTEVAPAFLEPEVLTAREQQVLELLARGYSNRQIADELIIGVRTAETHVDRVLRKLDLENRAQAIVWAHEHRSRVAR